MRRCRNVLAGLLLVLVAGPVLFARPVDLWSDDRLWKEADLVLIGTVKSSDDVPADHSNAKPDSRIDVDTTFTVGRVLKGKLAGKQVVVRHHRYFAKEAEIEVIDGPSFVEFNPGKKHEYLMFLKKAEGDAGVYEPVSGQYDPWQSFVRQVKYHVTSER
jgi:hypothetical protein